jgi:hypothetical protein
MARTSEYDPMIIETVNNTDRGLTTRELADAVGCSAQKAFVWVREHKDELVELGKDDHGGMLYVGTGNPLAASGKPAGKKGRGRPKKAAQAVTQAPRTGSGNGTRLAAAATTPKPGVVEEVEVVNGDGPVAVPAPATAPALVTTQKPHAHTFGTIEAGVQMTLVRLAIHKGGVAVTWQASDGTEFTGTLNL